MIPVRVPGAESSTGPEEMDALVVVHIRPASLDCLRPSSGKKTESGPEGAAQKPNAADLHSVTLEKVRPALVWGLLKLIAGAPERRSRHVQVAIVERVVARHEENRNVGKGSSRPSEALGALTNVPREDDGVGPRGRRRSEVVGGIVVLQVEVTENADAHVEQADRRRGIVAADLNRGYLTSRADTSPKQTAFTQVLGRQFERAQQPTRALSIHVIAIQLIAIWRSDGESHLLSGN